MSEAVEQHLEPDVAPAGQALVIRPDGTGEVAFLGVTPGQEIRGFYRGQAWAAREEPGATEPNEVATAFACSLGWTGHVLHGAVVFTGDGPTPDVPGVLVGQVVRFLGDLTLN